MRQLQTARAAHLGLLLATLLALPFLASCVSHAHPAPHAHHPRPTAVRVVVAKGHTHGARCGHYRHHGSWYHLRGHVHGPRCGHAFVGGVWVLRR